MRDRDPRRTARRKVRQQEREHAGIAAPACVLCIHEHHVVGRNHDSDFVVNRCERHHRERHELLLQSGIPLRHEPDAAVRIATALRALALHKRTESMSEADALERWAALLEQENGGDRDK